MTSQREIREKTTQILRRAENTCTHLAAIGEELRSSPPSSPRLALTRQCQELQEELRQIQTEANQYCTLPDELQLDERSCPQPYAGFRLKSSCSTSPDEHHCAYDDDDMASAQSTASHWRSAPTLVAHQPTVPVSRTVSVVDRVRQLKAQLAQLQSENQHLRSTLNSKAVELLELREALSESEALSKANEEACRALVDKATEAQQAAEHELELMEEKVQEMKQARDEARVRAQRAQAREEEG